MHGIELKRSGALALGVLVLMVGSPDAGAEDLSVHTEMSTDAVGSPIDPVVEEPLRSLATEASRRSVGAECGTMNGLALPLGMLLASGMGWIPRGRAQRTEVKPGRSAPRGVPNP